MIERIHAPAKKTAAPEVPDRPAVAPADGLLDIQRRAGNQAANATIQRKGDAPGLPSALKSGIENLSGYSMDDVRVHTNSALPAQLNAHAYAQGADIHVAPGAEKHLAHEAWHVVQQGSKKASAIEDEGSELEGEADSVATAIVASGSYEEIEHEAEE